MKILKYFMVAVGIFLPVLGAAAETSSNFPLYSLENVTTYEVSQDETTFFTFEKSESTITFVMRDLATGNDLGKAQIEAEQIYFMNTAIIGEDIFVFYVRVIDYEKELFETVIQKVDTQNGQVEKLYQSEELLGIAERFYATGNGLLLTNKRGGEPYLFSLESNKMSAITLEEDYRIRSFDFQQNSAVIIRQSNFNTSSKSDDEKSSYTEGDGNALEVYLCDFSDNFKLTEIGKYQPSYVISKNEAETSLPHFVIESDKYSWVEQSFMVNRFPIYPGALIGDPFLHSTWESLNGYEGITKLTFVSDHYVIANQFGDNGEESLVVFDIKNPKVAKTESVSTEDRERIKALFMGKSTTEKSALDPAVMSRVFDAQFYQIDMVTTEIDSSDGYVSSMTSTESFTAVGRDGEYSVLKKNEQLVPYISESFVLNEESALLFQDTLDLMFPLGHFAKEHKAFYQEGDQWIFVRDESFGEKEGVTVSVDGDGKIVGILPGDKISQVE